MNHVPSKAMDHGGYYPGVLGEEPAHEVDDDNKLVELRTHMHLSAAHSFQSYRIQLLPAFAIRQKSRSELFPWSAAGEEAVSQVP